MLSNPRSPTCQACATPAVYIVHELPEGSSWAGYEWRTQPCIEQLQTGACPAGDACPCAHSPGDLRPRPLPVPELRSWLQSAGWHLPPAAGQSELPLPSSAPYHPGAWQAAASIAEALRPSPVVQSEAAAAGGSCSAGVKRGPDNAEVACAAPAKRLHRELPAAPGAAAAADVDTTAGPASVVPAAAGGQHADAHGQPSPSPPPLLQLQEQGAVERQAQASSPDSGSHATCMHAAGVAAGPAAGPAPDGGQHGSAGSQQPGSQPPTPAVPPAGGGGSPADSAGAPPCEGAAGAPCHPGQEQLREAQAAARFLANSQGGLQQRLATAEAGLASRDAALQEAQAELKARPGSGSGCSKAACRSRLGGA